MRSFGLQGFNTSRMARIRLWMVEKQLKNETQLLMGLFALAGCTVVSGSGWHYSESGLMT